MSTVTLTAEQFSSLLDKSITKKITKADLEKRTNVINIDEFVNNLKCVSVHKLLNMELPDFMVYSIMENINSYEDEVLPFVCSNSQTKTFYYKENNEWLKGTSFIKPIYNKIYKNAVDQVLKKMNYKRIDSTDDDFEDEDENSTANRDDNEKQRILCNLCNVDKYPYDKCVDKVLSKLGKLIKQN